MKVPCGRPCNENYTTPEYIHGKPNVGKYSYPLWVVGAKDVEKTR